MRLVVDVDDTRSAAVQADLDGATLVVRKANRVRGTRCNFGVGRWEREARSRLVTSSRRFLTLTSSTRWPRDRLHVVYAHLRRLGRQTGSVARHLQCAVVQVRNHLQTFDSFDGLERQSNASRFSSRRTSSSQCWASAIASRHSALLRPVRTSLVARPISSSSVGASVGLPPWRTGRLPFCRHAGRRPRRADGPA